MFDVIADAENVERRVIPPMRPRVTMLFIERKVKI
jgi:hypothetical protein